MEEKKKKKTTPDKIQAYLDENGIFPKKKKYIPLRVASCILLGNPIPEIFFGIGCSVTNFNNALEAMKLLADAKTEEKIEEDDENEEK